MALLRVNFFFDTLGMSTSMNVILPEFDPADTCKIPVLYLLHGMSDDENAWCRFTSIERYARNRGIAVVMPTTGLGWYTDMKIGYNWFTYISDELPKIVANFFPCLSTRREETFVAGLSMGGYGALKLALRCPEKFAAAGCLSGALDVYSLMDGWMAEANSTLFSDIFGTKRELRKNGNDLMSVAKELKESGRPLPRLFFWCGKQDFLYKNNRSSATKIKNLGYDLTTKWTDGDHQWKYWDKYIQDILDWMGLTEKEAK